MLLWCVLAGDFEEGVAAFFLPFFAQKVFFTLKVLPIFERDGKLPAIAILLFASLRKNIGALVWLATRTFATEKRGDFRLRFFVLSGPHD